MNDEDFLRKLRARRPPSRTSTYDSSSEDASFGRRGELSWKTILDAYIDSGILRGMLWCVDFITRAKILWPDLVLGSKEHAIRDAFEGDLFIINPLMEPYRVAFQVKSSATYQNVSIDSGELFNSRPRYLLAWTPGSPVKNWITTMDEARAKAFVCDGSRGSFWVVPHEEVRELTLGEVFDGL